VWIQASQREIAQAKERGSEERQTHVLLLGVEEDLGPGRVVPLGVDVDLVDVGAQVGQAGVLACVEGKRVGQCTLVESSDGSEERDVRASSLALISVNEMGFLIIL